MATPTKSQIILPGALGEIPVDVLATDRRAPSPAVLVVHGFKGFKDWGMFPPFTDRLARAGFTAVSFNLSGSGVDRSGQFAFPDRFGHSTFSADQEDLDRIVEALDAGHLGVPRPTSVGIVGHSRGGGTAILTAARLPRIAAAVTWAAISTVRRWTDAQLETWRAAGQLDIVNSRTGERLPLYLDTVADLDAHATSTLDIAAAAQHLTTPWLLIHGDADETVPVQEAHALIATAASRPERSHLIVVGAGHTFGAAHPMGVFPPALESVFEASVSFLAKYL